MPYTVQIEKLGPVPPDALTTLDLSNPAVIRTQDNDRIIITIPDGVAFGNFDPGQIVGLLNVPYMMFGWSMKSSLATTTGSVGIGGPAIPGGDNTTRKIFTLGSPPIFLAQTLVPRDHIITFFSADAGPFTIITTFEPLRDVGLVSAYVQGRV
jgi:hypothetical protein